MSTCALASGPPGPPKAPLGRRSPIDGPRTLLRSQRGVSEKRTEEKATVTTRASPQPPPAVSGNAEAAGSNVETRGGVPPAGSQLRGAVRTAGKEHPHFLTMKNDTREGAISGSSACGSRCRVWRQGDTCRCQSGTKMQTVSA